MTDEPIAGIDTEETAPVVVDKRGVLMRERESYERVIEGLKMASDGAHHLHQSRQDGNWHQMTQIFDKLRAAIARLGGLSTEAVDSNPTTELWSAKTMGIHASYDRVYRGLDMAQKGARQVASCHRGDLKWSMYAMAIEKLRDQSSVLIRMKQAKSPIMLPPGYMH